MWKISVFLLLLCFFAIKVLGQDDCMPYGARLSLGYYYSNASAEDVVDITFNTLSPCENSYVKLIKGNVEARVDLFESKTLNMTQIYENNSKVHYNYVTFVHTAKLSTSQVYGGETVKYKLMGSEEEFTEEIEFRVPNKTANTTRVVLFGDMDSRWIVNNSQSTFDWFQSQAKTNRSAYDLLLFLGDMAYDLESDNCQRGDEWMRNISTFTSAWPFLVAPGNHDSGNNTHFDYMKYSFPSPQLAQYNTESEYYNLYSFDLGLAHYVSFHPYWIVYNKSTEDERKTLYNFMEQDLRKAYENRQKVPWIIVFSHYPMYCSDPTDPQCGYNNEALSGFAELFSIYHVNLYIGAHQHNYERDAPFKHNVTTNFISDGPGQHSISNAEAPVYIVEGAAGNDYYMASEDYPIQPFTVFQSEQRGVGVLTILNRTHLEFQQIGTLKNNQQDYVYVIRSDDDDDGGKQGGSSLTALWVILGIVIAVIIMGLVFVCARQVKKQREKQREIVGYEEQIP